MQILTGNFGPSTARYLQRRTPLRQSLSSNDTQIENRDGRGKHSGYVIMVELQLEKHGLHLITHRTNGLDRTLNPIRSYVSPIDR